MAFNVIHRDNENKAKGPHVKQKNESAKQGYFDPAIQYLRESSKKAADIISYLERSEKIINIIIDTQNVMDRWVNCWMPVAKIDGNFGSDNYQESTIRWRAGKPKKRGEGSAAMGLMHELGHELQWRVAENEIRKMNVMVFYRRKLTGFKTDNKKYLQNMEDFVVGYVETPVAQDINIRLKFELDIEAIPSKEYNDQLEPIRDRYARIRKHRFRRDSIDSVEKMLQEELLEPEKPMLKRLGARHFPKKPKR